MLDMLVRIVSSLIFVLLYVGCLSRPLEQKNNEKSNKTPPTLLLDFMKRYGYIQPDTNATEAIYTFAGLSHVIKNIQKFGAIPQTGDLDNATLKLMKTRRCGVPDIIKNKRDKRYILGSKGWNKRNLSYFIANWSPYLGEEAVDKSIKRALDTWGKYARLQFERKHDPNADIVVAFATGYHGDSYPFDGRGDILAHAYFPHESSHYGGDIHFDNDEDWTADPTDDGTHFFSVAAHEIGHSLGLAHSPVQSSVMFPYYKGYSNDFALDYDDILGMYDLYIKRHIDGDGDLDMPQTPHDDDQDYDFTFSFETTPATTHADDTYTPTTESTYNNTIVTYEEDVETVDDHKGHDTTHGIPPTSSPSLPDICQGYFDAVATLRDELFIFKDQYIWRLPDKHTIERGYPVPINQMFSSLPKDIKRIDAAYERPDGMIVLFTGDTYWVYDGNRFIESSPKPLTYYGLPNTLDKVDAVQVWAKNGKTYIYRGDAFWRYNETTKMLDPGYPKHIERWRGVPPNLDAATTWKDGITYFFKGNMYWRFDNNWVIVTDSSPMPTAQVWLGCPKEEYHSE